MNNLAFAFLLMLTTLGRSAHGISLPDSVSRAEIGLNAAREFSANGPIHNTKCATVYKEFFFEAHDDHELPVPKKKNPFRDTFLRMKNYDISRLDCRAYVNENPDLCESNDCRAILSQNKTLCQSTDCQALLSKKSELCENNLCQAFVAQNASACSGDCAAYLRNDPDFCESDDCRAYLERRSVHCRTNICFALVQKETFFCFRED